MTIYQKRVRLMKTLFAVILLIFVIGCSHPLEIVGNGDIISASGEHDCLLEDNPCTNYVIGDYDVTYTAMPRAGWIFSEWDGCGNQLKDRKDNQPEERWNKYSENRCNSNLQDR